MTEISLNGWAVIQGSGDPRLRTGWVPGANRRLTTRKEALPLFLAVAADWHKWINAIDEGGVDTGGYANRDARGVPGRKSNHASGTAIDIDWSGVGAPVKRNLIFWRTKARQMRRILKIYSILDWGGDWSPKYWDPMHLELRAGSDLGQVRALIKKLGIGQDGVRTKNRFGLPIRKAAADRTAPPSYPALLAASLSGVPTAGTYRLAMALKALGHFTGTPIPGRQAYPFKAMQNWQRAREYKATGLYGPIAHRQIFVE